MFLTVVCTVQQTVPYSRLYSTADCTVQQTVPYSRLNHKYNIPCIKLFCKANFIVKNTPLKKIIYMYRKLHSNQTVLVQLSVPYVVRTVPFSTLHCTLSFLSTVQSVFVNIVEEKSALINIYIY